MNRREIEARIAEIEAYMATPAMRDTVRFVEQTRDLLRVLKLELKAASKGLETPVKDVSFAAQHIREHRPGRPSKINCDPELRAFILARIDTMTFEGLASAVAEHFPPDRRVGKSGIHRWWDKYGRSYPESLPR